MSDNKITAFHFDATQHAPAQSFDVLPKGWYMLQATEAEVKPTRTGDGKYIAVTVEIMGPDFAVNRKMWKNFNVENPNPKAVEIGVAEFSAFLHAVGVLQVTDLQQLLMKPCYAKLSIRKGNDDYDDSNDIDGWKSLSEQVKLATPNVVKAGANGGITPPPGFGGPAAAFPAPVQNTAAPQAPLQANPFTQPQQPFAAPAPQQAPQPAQAPQFAPQQPAQQPVAQPQQQPQPQFAQPAPQQQAPVQQPAQQPAAQPVVPQPQQPQFGAQPWATTTVSGEQQAALNAGTAPAQPQAPAEPPHPAQQAEAPWAAAPAETPAPFTDGQVQQPAPWNTPA